MTTTNPSHSRIPADAVERWELVRRVCSGAQQVREGGFLRYLNAQDKSRENIERNADYIKGAVFYNVTGRTRDGLLGLAFRRDPDSAAMPKALEYMLSNVDGNKTSIYQQSQAAVLSVLETGRHGLLVDFVEGLKRPQIKAYQAEDIINWRVEIVGGEPHFVLLVLHELHEEESGYETKLIDQWREYRLADGAVTVRLWRMVGKTVQEVKDPDVEGDTILQSPAGKLTAIPFVFIGAQNNDESIDEAPLFDLAHINLAHYQNSADYEDAVWLAGQPQPWISGLTEEWRDHIEAKGTMYWGARVPILLPESGAMGFAQVEPTTMAKEAMDQKETQMAALGAQLLENTKAAKTATQDDNEKEAATSVLSMVVANVSEAYARCFEFCAQFMATTFSPPAQYKINQDFVRMSADPQLIASIVDVWQKGLYAKADARAFLRRLNVIAVERTDELIEADMETEGPALGTMTDPANDPGDTGDDGQ